jgi:2-O-methyltransferase
MNKNEIRQLCNTEHPILFEIGSAEGLDTEDFIRTFIDLDFKLYCFEPYERNVMEFRNTIKDYRVKLYPVAVGDTDGEVDFHVSLDKNIYSSSLKEPGDALFKTWSYLFPNRFSFGKIRVKSIKLDTFVKENRIGIIDFIWLDCQGAEDLVIKGGRETFTNRVRYLYTEYSNQEIYVGEPSLNQILNMLPNYSVIKNFSNKSGDVLGGDVLLRNNAFKIG